jgi:hypothetical protein
MTSYSTGSWYRRGFCVGRRFAIWCPINAAVGGTSPAALWQLLFFAAVGTGALWLRGRATVSGLR